MLSPDEPQYQPGMSAEDLYKRYTSFGEDPFIVVIDGTDNDANFSAWRYAKERCGAICSPAGQSREVG